MTLAVRVTICYIPGWNLWSVTATGVVLMLYYLSTVAHTLQPWWAADLRSSTVRWSSPRRWYGSSSMCFCSCTIRIVPWTPVPGVTKKEVRLKPAGRVSLIGYYQKVSSPFSSFISSYCCPRQLHSLFNSSFILTAKKNIIALHYLPFVRKIHKWWPLNFLKKGQ